MAKHEYVPKEQKFAKVGGVATGGLKKSGADLKEYSPCHIDAHSSIKAGLNVEDQRGKPHLYAWESGNEFLGSKKNEG